MQTKLTKLASVAAIASMTMMLAACGNNNSNSNSNTPSSGNESASAPQDNAPASSGSTDSEAPIKLRFVGHGSNFTTGWEAVMADAKKKGFDIEVEKLPEGQPGDDIIKTRLATKEYPDILLDQAGASMLTRGNPDELFVDMSNQKWVQNLNLDTWGRAFTYNGKVVGAPFQGAQTMGVFYNKKVFEKLGLSVPTTYDAFLAVCDAIAKAGITPVYLPGKDPWTLQMPALFSTSQKDSADIADKLNANQMRMTDYADLRLGLDTLKDIIDKGYGSKDPFAHGYEDAQKAIAMGETGMFMMGAWITTDIKKKFPDKVDDLGIFPMPFPGGKTPTINVSPSVALYIMKGKNEEGALKFMDYFESIDTQNIFFGAEGGTPEIRGVTNVTMTEPEKEAKAVVEAGNGFVNFQGAGLKYVADIFGDLCAELAAGKKTTQQVLEAMDKELIKQSKLKGDPNFK